MKRKTIEVEGLKNRINNLLTLPDGPGPFGMNNDKRQALASLLESILHETSNYRGFSHNYWSKQGYNLWVEAGKPDFPQKQAFIGNELNRNYI